MANPASGAHTSLRLDVVADIRGLIALRDEWNVLLQASRTAGLFLTWEWISTWWSVYGRADRLHIITARDGTGRLVGLAPFKRRRRSVFGVYEYDSLEFIGEGGDVTPEYLDLIATPEHERRVRTLLADHLLADKSWGAVDLRPISAESPNVRLLGEHFSNRHGGVHLVEDSVCPILQLPPTVDAFLAQRSKNYRKKMGEYERKCKRDGIRLSHSTTSDELHRDMSALVDLHHQRWQGRSRAFQSPEYCRFHSDVAQAQFTAGRTRMLSLQAGDRPIALLYCFAYGPRFYYYQGGWDPNFAHYRPGLVLMHKAIQDAIGEGATIFDFLRGEEEYKYRWATARVTNVRLLCWRGTGARAVEGVRQLVKRALRLRHRSSDRLHLRLQSAPTTFER